MRTNVFLRSTRRQPVRTVFLLLVTALVTFTFVGRASEYLLIRQETERLGNFYRSVGSLKPQESVTRRAFELVREDPRVKMADCVRYGSAVMDGIYNSEATEENGARFLRDDVFFYGTLMQKTEGKTFVMSSGSQAPAYYFYFQVDSVLAGYPEAIEAGDTVRLVNSNEDAYMGRVYMDLTETYEALEVGGRYLLRGEYDCTDQACSIKALDGTSSFYFKQPGGAIGPFFYPVEPGEELDLSAPEFAAVAEQIRIVDDNQHSISTVASQDVGVLAEVWRDSFAPYLVDGRWPDSVDNAQGNRVCVIPEDLARSRGLSVGDTLSLTLRDLPHPYRRGYLYDDAWQASEIENGPREAFEIVGIFNSMSSVEYYTYKLFLPASAVPDSFQYGDPFQCDLLNDRFKPDYDAVIFALNSPAEEARFLAETGETLSAMGLEAAFVETGWDNFQNAAGPMRQSSLFSAAVFTSVLLAALSLAAFLYYRMRRGDFAKARALGLPAKICGRQAALPLLLIGAAGTLAGSALGWRYTQERAGETLRALSEFGELSGGLSTWWLASLWAVCFALLAVLAAGGAALLARRPVLSLLQGGTVQKAPPKALRREKTAPMAVAVQPAEINLSLLGQIIGSAPAVRKGTGAGHVLRFVWRHIWRVPVKSGLAAALAAGFVVGLAAIQLAIADSGERIDTLYNNTVVELDLIREDTGLTGSGYINKQTVEDIQETGFVRDAYLEGITQAAILPCEDGWDPGKTVSLRDVRPIKTQITSFDNLSEFLEVSSARDLRVTYLDGWNGSLFSRDWSEASGEPAHFPLLMPKYLYDIYCERYGLQLGGTVGISCGGLRQCEVAGYYQGSTPNKDAFTAALLMPNSAVEAMTRERMHYAKVRFQLDPSKNRELDLFRVELDRILEENSGLRALLWDEELKQAVEPLEDSVALMRLLYPVVIVLSVLVAAGISVLFVMLSAKEAAILRVQGTTRLRTVLMLGLQQVFTCFAGLALGLTGTLLYLSGTRPALLTVIAPGAAVCAALYLMAGIAGAVVSSAAVTGKNPLEMLQVRE